MTPWESLKARISKEMSVATGMSQTERGYTKEWATVRAAASQMVLNCVAELEAAPGLDRETLERAIAIARQVQGEWATFHTVAPSAAADVAKRLEALRDTEAPPRCTCQIDASDFECPVHGKPLEPGKETRG